MLDHPLKDLNAWTTHLVEANIPVLSSSVAEIAFMAQAEEARGNVDAHTLAPCLMGDPLMTLKVLAHVSRFCTRLQVEPPETLTGAIVMQGIGPFFKAFSALTSVDETLAPYPGALEGLQRTLHRGRRAAHMAVSFALHRQDEDAEVIQQAALLHDFAEMLMWCEAPALMLKVEHLLSSDHTLRSDQVQSAVLNVTLVELAQSLMHAWQLPDLLIRCTDDRHAEHPTVRTVMLAVRVARHTQYGWDAVNAHAALPDDISDIAQLLTLSKEAAARKIHDLDT
jgi:HD-like signal output (HDOD) protein